MTALKKMNFRLNAEIPFLGLLIIASWAKLITINELQWAKLIRFSLYFNLVPAVIKILFIFLFYLVKQFRFY